MRVWERAVYTVMINDLMLCLKKLTLYLEKSNNHKETNYVMFLATTFSVSVPPITIATGVHSKLGIKYFRR